MSFILSAGKFVTSFISGLAGDLYRWAVAFGMLWLGKKLERQRWMEKASEIKDKQLEIASRRTLHRQQLLDRMFKRERSD